MGSLPTITFSRKTLRISKQGLIPQVRRPTRKAPPALYTEEAIVTLKWNEHIRRRPGMYIGKLGDGSYSDDGIYILLKEVVDNSIDEFNMGVGKRIRD